MNNNEFIEIFETRLKEYTGAPYVVAVDRCTNAILLALESQYKRKTKITIPNHTYMSVPMTLINYGYNVWLEDREWTGNYRLGKTNVFDYAVGFEKNMYKFGEVQCVSFQQKKRVGIGKGGAILLDDYETYLKLRRMRHDGRNSAIPTNRECEEAPDAITIGYHMNMIPEEAARGTLLLNQLSENYSIGSWKDYPDLSLLPCFKEYL